MEAAQGERRHENDEHEEQNEKENSAGDHHELPRVACGAQSEPAGDSDEGEGDGAKKLGDNDGELHGHDSGDGEDHLEDDKEREGPGLGGDEGGEAAQAFTDGGVLKRDRRKDKVGEERGAQDSQTDGKADDGVDAHQVGEELRRRRLSGNDVDCGHLGQEPRERYVEKRAAEDGKDEAEDELEADPAPGLRAVSAPGGGNKLLVEENDVEEAELEAGSDVEEDEHDGGEDGAEAHGEEHSREAGAGMSRRGEEGKERSGDKEGRQCREVGGGCELPGAARFEGLEEEGFGAFDSRRDGFSGGQGSHGFA